MRKTGPDPAKVRALILEVVDNQIKEGTPPETGETLRRLRTRGLPEMEARRLIAGVVACEIFAILKRGETFDQTRFVSRLNQLPEMPWLDEDDDGAEEEAG
jgi:hypothetical protein